MTTIAEAASLSGRRCRILVAVLLGLLTLSVIGMHQLSLGHAFATPSASHPDEHAAGHHAGADHHHATDTVSHLAPAVTRSAVMDTVTGFENTGTEAAAFGIPPLDRVSGVMPGSGSVLTAASPISDPGGAPDDDGCPGCAEHSMALGACLLALTLLVLSWQLLLPRARLLPPMLRLRLAPAVVMVLRRIPALSLAELSILRT